MLTVEEVAERLKVTPRTIYRWIDEDKLKALKIEGIVRIKEEDYQEFINKKAA